MAEQGRKESKGVTSQEQASTTNAPKVTELTETNRGAIQLLDRGVQLNTFQDLIAFAEYIATSELVPKNFKTHPADIVIAIEWGREVGLSKMQSLASIAVINGRATVWGDAVPGLCFATGLVEYAVYPSLEEIRKAGYKCEVRVKRVNMPEVVGYYDKALAQQAGLWGKEGPWRTSPERMIFNRARNFAYRDAFPDALRGLHPSDDFDAVPSSKEPRDITPKRKLKKVTASIAKDETKPSDAPQDDAATNGDDDARDPDEVEAERSDAQDEHPELPPDAALESGGERPEYVDPVAPSESTETCKTQVRMTGGTCYTAGITGITLAKVQVAARKFDVKHYRGASLDALGNVAANNDWGDRVDWFHLTEQEGKTFLQYLNTDLNR